MTKQREERQKKVPLVWEGSVVGWVEDLKVENWFNYGRWVPSDAVETERFLNAIESSGEAVVSLGDAKGFVHELPEDGYINVKIWPGLVE